MAQSKFGSHLLESEDSRDIGKQESNLVGLDLEKIALMARGGVSGQGKDLKLGIQVGPHLNPSAASFTECLLSVSCVLCSAWDAANFQGMLSNCLPSRSLLIPAASRRVLAIDSDANGQITRQKSLLEGSESTSGPEASTLYCVNYSLF